MHAWEAIQNTVDYIEGNLSKDLEIEELAKIAALSPFYYQRLFSRLVRKPVKEYIKLRRLAAASQDLKDEKRRILDIALDYGFGSHESFTRAFKSTFGMTPMDFRTNPVRLNNFIKPELILNYSLIEEDVPLITDNLVIEISRKKLEYKETFLGITGQINTTGQIPVGESTGVDESGSLWDDFHRIKAAIPNLLPGGNELGVSFMAEGKDQFTYFTGALAAEGSIAEDYTVWELPAGEYIVCCFEAENFEQLTTVVLDKAVKYLFSTWLINNKYKTEPFLAERYFHTTSEANYMEIWVIPIPLE